MQKALKVFFFFVGLSIFFFGAFYFFRSIPSQSLLAQIAGFGQKEKIFEEEFGNLKREIKALSESLSERESKNEEILKNLQEIKDQIVFLRKQINISRSESENLKKEKKISEKKEIICQFQSKEPKREVIFNEICWMGDEDSPTNEWFELKNISQKKINLSGWQILNKNQKIKIFLEEIELLPGEIFLFKRGDDFTGAIKNSQEALFLFDEDCNLQDIVEANPNWPAGDNKTKRTMERKEDLSWQTSEESGGTPGKENSKGFVILEEKEQEKEKRKAEPKISLNYPSEIFSQKEFEVLLSVSDLKYDTYDVKISILKISDETEQKRTISEISFTDEEWQDSYKYLSNVFTGNSFSGKFKLRIPEEFSGEAEILVKIRNQNKKIVAEFSEKITVSLAPKIEIETFSETKTSIKEPPAENVFATNLLKNEFFEEWEENDAKPIYWVGSHSFKTNWFKDSENVLVGNYSVKVKGGGERTLKQLIPELKTNTSYYTEVWVKGTGRVKIAIVYPSGYFNYSDWLELNNSSWVKITHQAKTSATFGEKGGIAVTTVEEGGDDSSSTLYIGAAWLSTSPSPQNWPR